MEMDTLKDHLKLVMAHDLAKDLMYSWQRLFEFHEKPGHYPVWFLADATEPPRTDKIKIGLVGDNWAYTLVGIVKTFVTYYDHLYATHSPLECIIDMFFTTFLMPQLTSNHQRILQSPIILQEIETVINNLKVNKMPGLDGLTCESNKKKLR